MFMKKLFYLIALVAFTLTSCEKNELVKQEISQETEQKIDNIISVMKTNSNVASSIKSSIIGQQQRVSANGETPTLDNETQAAVDAFVENPREVLTEIALEEQGAEKIDLLESVYMQEDKEIIMEKLETFVPADSLAMYDNALSEAENSIYSIGQPQYTNSLLQKAKLVDYDKKLHFMAGASVCMGAGALVYVFAKWFSIKVKAAAIIVVGISAAVLFGLAKEIYDEYDYGGADLNDFLATFLGGVTGATIAWGIYATLYSGSPLLAGVLTGAVGVVFGWEPGKQLLVLIGNKIKK